MRERLGPFERREHDYDGLALLLVTALRQAIPLPVQEPPTSKACSRCGRVLPLAFFNVERRAHDGRRTSCRACQTGAEAARPSTDVRTMQHMEPGERVSLIKKVATTLAPQGWHDIDLVLGQFGFPTNDDWRGDEYPYVVEMIKHADDDCLADLNAYLHPGDVPPTDPQPAERVVEDPDSPWTTGGFRLFLTHLASQRENVGKLKAALAEHSIEAFVAHETIEPGKEWQDVIESGLRSCDALAAWLTAGIKESSWCDQEIGFAVCRGILVVPIRFGVDPYGFIGKYQGMTIRDNDKVPVIARSIFDLLVTHELSRGAMARALVWRYENTDSFDAARTNLGYLRRIPPEAWTPALKEQALRVPERNYQVSEAWWGQRALPDAVRELIPD